MIIIKKTHLFFISSLLAMSNHVNAAELAASEQSYPKMGNLYLPLPAGALGVYRQGNQLIIPYEDSRGAIGMDVREIPQGSQALFPNYIGLQGATVLFESSDSPRMRDPAIRHHSSQTVKIKAKDLQVQLLQVEFPEYLFKFNYLDLSNFNLSASCLTDFLSQADLSNIREIDVSCPPEHASLYNANDFLAKLFANNTLRSLTTIDASGSNISKATLEMLRTKSNLREPLIRDTWKLDESYGKKVAPVEIKIVNTPIASLQRAEKKQLQVPGESRFSILYRSSDYFPGSAAHLQLLLK
ncbi:MAG: hypothetical protein K2Y18_00210 [Alphaproteobacteria bacterium]|jgi:hypothetical protein|nr:hypothetical protein [Alphaproteobacteria bacterium]